MSSLWNLGFRPFFLFGVAWSILQIVVWAAFQAGWISAVPLSDPLVWHAHEMIFGYVLAIVAGFILTASQNWTGIPGVHGTSLKALVLIWGLARASSIFWGSAPLLFALVDLSFLPILAWALKPYLWQKSQSHNKVFFLLFLGLFLLNLLVHLSVLGWYSFPARSALHGSIYLAILMIAVIAGRVIPFFAGVVIPGIKPVRKVWVEILSFASLTAFSFSAVFWEFSKLTAGLAVLAALAHTIRWILWRPWSSVRLPVLLVLYVAYLWIPVGLMLGGLAALGLVPPSIATHAFTVGCIGTMIYGMITRVALGHSGRPIRVSPFIVFGYALITTAALARVLGPWIFPQHSLMAFEVSGSLWVLAHVIFLFIYAPILCSPRADGKAG